MSFVLCANYKIKVLNLFHFAVSYAPLKFLLCPFCVKNAVKIDTSKANTLNLCYATKKSITPTTMYALLFDFELEALQTMHPKGATRAVMDIRRVLEDEFKFKWQQDGLYFGDASVNAVDCVLAVQTLAERFDWFTTSVRTSRMLRIDEVSDLSRVYQSQMKII